jgi:hypothetical protein
MSINEFVKDPDSVEPFHIVWCSLDNTNDGSSSDTGELQGETISSSSWTVPTGITKDSDNKLSVTIQGITYVANTVATIWLSGGTAGQDYALVNQIETSGNRTLDHTILIKVRDV